MSQIREECGAETMTVVLYLALLYVAFACGYTYAKRKFAYRYEFKRSLDQ